jgi:NAD(P)H-hydrate epimerase
MILLSAAESRELDRLSQSKYGIDSYALMRRAGEAVADLTLRRWPDAARGAVAIVAGKGNNGGDGLVAARKLTQAGVAARVLMLARPETLKGDTARAWRDFAAVGGAAAIAQSDAEIDAFFAAASPAAIIDAIFGIGLNAEVRGAARRAIDRINQSGAPAVAVDIASGVNADSGAIMGAAVRAALTATFGYAKYGHVSYPGAQYCGELEIAEIGFAPAAIGEIAPRGRLIEASEAARMVAPRAANSHKGSYGHLLIVAGSYGKSGAAVLAGRGALRGGAGLVTLAIPEPALPMAAAGQAELMTEPMPAVAGGFAAAGTIARLAGLIGAMNAVAAGPGIGVSAESLTLVDWLIREASAPNRPLLLDADALNAVAEAGGEMMRAARGPVVITPHPGEAARLLRTTPATINADRIGAARSLAELTGASVLLKGARTVVAADGAIAINSSGNPGMAAAGMGDVLSGLTGALLAGGMAPGAALSLGAWMHGDAGDRAARKIGPAGFLAGELAAELPAVRAALIDRRGGG